jgi:thiol-disulfide isomerase/thioredoxin
MKTIWWIIGIMLMVLIVALGQEINPSVKITAPKRESVLEGMRMQYEETISEYKMRLAEGSQDTASYRNQIESLRQVLIALEKQEKGIGKKVENLEFRLVSDNSLHTLSEHRGKLIVLNFWATWCGSCVKELPDLSRLYQTYKSKGIVVITLSDVSREKLMEFITHKPFETINAYANMEKIKYEVPARPFTVIIDQKGIVKDIFLAPREYDAWVAEIAPYIKEK